MMGKKGKVIVGMSGGVDSAVTAYLMKEEGYEVIGVNLLTRDCGKIKSRELEDSEKSAERIGIAFRSWNVAESFRKCVTEPFAREYVEGRTPNPCIECNHYVKWEGLMRAADEFNADYVATGHYAVIRQLENGRYTAGQAKDLRKDQSYMLCMLSQAQLSRTVLPLGRLSKTEVRQIAGRIGLSVADKADSQEICFVSDGNYAEFIEKELDVKVPGEGDFVDAAGNILGRHKGIAHYTIGQRKGLGLALGYPAYVRQLDPEKNQVMLGTEESLYTLTVLCDALNFMGVSDIGFGESLMAHVKIRYRHRGEAAVIERAGDDLLRISFEKPVRAPAPGQSAVFYDEAGCIVGAGKIR